MVDLGSRRLVPRRRGVDAQRVGVSLEALSSGHLGHLPQRLPVGAVEEVRPVLSPAPVLPPALLQQLRRQVHLELRVARGRGSGRGLGHGQRTRRGARRAGGPRGDREAAGARARAGPGHRHLEGRHVGGRVAVSGAAAVVVGHVVVDMCGELLVGRGAGPRPGDVLRHGHHPGHDSHFHTP